MSSFESQIHTFFRHLPGQDIRSLLASAWKKEAQATRLNTKTAALTPWRMMERGAIRSLTGPWFQQNHPEVDTSVLPDTVECVRLSLKHRDLDFIVVGYFWWKRTLKFYFWETSETLKKQTKPRGKMTGLPKNLKIFRGDILQGRKNWMNDNTMAWQRR